MINQNVLSAAVTIADNLAERGLHASPRPDTPFVDLVNASIPVRTFSGESTADAVEAAAAQAGAEDGAAINQHDVIQDEFVQKGADTLRAILAKAKGVIVPAVVRCAEKAVADYGPEDQNPFEIRRYEIPDFARNNVFQSSIAEHDDAVILVDRAVGLPELDFAGLVELLKSGVPDYDDQIAGYLATLPEDFVLRVYNCMRSPEAGTLPFVLTTQPGRVTGQVVDIRGFDGAIIAHLIARGLRTNVPANIPMGLDDWTLLMSQYGRLTATMCHLYIKKAQLHMQSVQVVLGADAIRANTSPTITVFGPTYNIFLENGGSPELLMGSALSGKRPMTAAKILEGREEFGNLWQQYLGGMESRNVERLSRDMPGIIANVVINALPE